MSGRWPGWRTLPGIEIAPLAEKARAQGAPYRQHSYVWGTDQQYVTSSGWEVAGDGTVTIAGEGWEPVIEDGMLTGLRGIKGGTIETLVQITALVVPEGEPPWSPSLTARLPPEQIGMGRIGDSMADGIDIDNEQPGAGLCVGFAAPDGSWTSLTWGITSESAASVIALIRERHGEPMAEFTVDAEHAGPFRSAVMGAIDDGGVFTCAHEDAP